MTKQEIEDKVIKQVADRIWNQLTSKQYIQIVNQMDKPVMDAANRILNKVDNKVYMRGNLAGKPKNISHKLLS